MKQCPKCKRSVKKLILVDDEMDEKTYLCKGCCKEVDEDVKERMRHAKKIFGFPSHDHFMRMAKSLGGESIEDITVDEKNTILPRWFLEKGVMNIYDFLKTKEDISRQIYYITKSLNRKNRSKIGKKMDRHSIKLYREELKNFRIEYFHAADVENLFRKLIKEGKLKWDSEKS